MFQQKNKLKLFENLLSDKGLPLCWVLLMKFQCLTSPTLSLESASLAFVKSILGHVYVLCI